MFKKLYKNSGREKGTLRFFREKLNRRNVTADVKHYEDCEQLFFSVGRCYVVEALMEFFQMADAKHQPSANGPHSVYVLREEYQKEYMSSLTYWISSWMSMSSVKITMILMVFGVMVQTSFDPSCC